MCILLCVYIYKLTYTRMRLYYVCQSFTLNITQKMCHLQKHRQLKSSQCLNSANSFSCDFEKQGEDLLIPVPCGEKKSNNHRDKMLISLP